MGKGPWFMELKNDSGKKILCMCVCRERETTQIDKANGGKPLIDEPW